MKPYRPKAAKINEKRVSNSTYFSCQLYIFLVLTKHFDDIYFDDI